MIARIAGFKGSCFNCQFCQVCCASGEQVMVDEYERGGNCLPGCSAGLLTSGVPESTGAGYGFGFGLMSRGKVTCATAS